MKKIVFWDNDGVLVETEHLFLEATNKILQEFDLQMNEPDYIRISLQEGKSLFHAMVGSQCSDEEIEQLKNRRDEYYEQLLATKDIFIEGMDKLLSSLAEKGVRMAVVTSSRRAHFDIIHKRTGFLKYFEFVLSNEDYTQSKPYPEPYLLALERAKVSAHDALVVEDSVRGLQAAVSAGIDCIAFPSELTKNGDFSSAKNVVSTVAELKKCIFSEVK